ncbi:MAG: leucyl aminopeptidase [Bacteroidetes bacterium]|nr:leucyl aminopeptidase [Bacteroidota bacterium]
MITSIEKTRQISPNYNSIYLITDAKNLRSYGFTTIEISYIKTQNTVNEVKVFAFNRFKRWDFVQIIKKDDKDFTNIESCRKAGDALLCKINGNKISQVLIVDVEDNDVSAFAYAEGMALGNYQFIKYKKGKDSKKSFNTLAKISILSKKISEKSIKELNILIEAVYQSRDFVNEPVSYLNAKKLAEEAESLCKKEGAKVEIMNKLKIETLKMGGLLAVNKGSIDPPTFTAIEWKPAKHINKNPYIFVGKGVVFDTGGINIKSGSNMTEMKCDMGGAATVIGTLYAIAKAKLPIYVIGLIPATDNRPDGNAQVPGDIITMYDGTTVEVLNTDAEGRLILADALSYSKKYKPELVIDIATLTGAAHAAVGKYAMIAMGSKYKKYMDELKISGNNVFERIVEFPLWDDYKELLKSEVADMKNIGGQYAGAISAGKFLEHFTDYPWIHLDIAGPAFMDSRDSYRGQGGTGWGIRILFDFIKLKCK